MPVIQFQDECIILGDIKLFSLTRIIHTPQVPPLDLGHMTFLEKVNFIVASNHQLRSRSALGAPDKYRSNDSRNVHRDYAALSVCRARLAFTQEKNYTAIF